MTLRTTFCDKSCCISMPSLSYVCIVMREGTHNKFRVENNINNKMSSNGINSVAGALPLHFHYFRWRGCKNLKILQCLRKLSKKQIMKTPTHPNLSCFITSNPFFFCSTLFRGHYHKLQLHKL